MHITEHSPQEGVDSILIECPGSGLSAPEDNDPSEGGVATADMPWPHLADRTIEGGLSPGKILVTANLDWAVDQHPLYAAIDKNMVRTNRSALVRSSDNSILTVTPSTWKPVQNREAFNVFEGACKAGAASMVGAGFLEHGRLVWALARLQAAFEVDEDDRVDGYILLSIPHEYGKATQLQVMAVRAVCGTSFTYSKGYSGFSFVIQDHRSEFDLERATRIVLEANAIIERTGDYVEWLTSHPMGWAQTAV